MQKQIFIISGGFLDDSYDAYLGKLTLTESSSKVSIDFEVIYNAIPTENLKMINKGFTGGSIYKDRLWVCSSNQVFSFNLVDFKIESIINDSLFNDLHYVLSDANGLSVVNTGLESIDHFNYNGERVARDSFVNDKITEKRIVKYKDFRKTTSNSHFMHANHCFRDASGKLLITFLRQKCIVESENWDWISPQYPSPPHEGFIHNFFPENKECLWVSTVAGEVFATDPITLEVVKSWNLLERGLPSAWFRGLCVLNNGFLVGATQITEKNVGYYYKWGKNDVECSKSYISFIPFAEEETVVSVDIEPERLAKIFSIIPFPK